MSEHVHDDLVDVLLDDAPMERTAEIDRHLQECTECSAALHRLRSMREVVTSAPLEPAPPAGLEEDVFVRIKHARTAELLETAPLGPEPDDGLAERVFSDARLGKVVSMETARRDKRSKAMRGVLIGVAAALIVALGFTTMRMASLNGQLNDLKKEDSGIASGHPQQVVALSGEGTGSELELVHFRHDNYRLQLVADDFPVQKDGHHYEVWLEGSGGEAFAGSFRILRPDKVTFVFNVGIDPSEFTKVEIVEEPDDGIARRQGEIVSEGMIDPAQGDHMEHP